MLNFNGNIRIYSNIRIYWNIRIFFLQYEYIRIRIRIEIALTNIFVFVFGPEKNIRSPLDQKVVLPNPPVRKSLDQNRDGAVKYSDAMGL